MSSQTKGLMAQVNYGGTKMSLVSVMQALDALPASIPLTTTEAAIFLRMSVTTMERMRIEGSGPEYFQGGTKGAKGTNQQCLYFKKDLIAWQTAHMHSNTGAAAIAKGQIFATLFDLTEQTAFYVNEHGEVESQVESRSLETVIERIGTWDIAWLNATEAASRRWSDLSSHKEFSAGVRSLLSQAISGIDAGLDATEIGEVVPREAKSGAATRKDTL